MRKYLIGFIVGAIVSVAGTAYADDIKNVIGLTVQGSFPVKVNGVKAGNDAVIIDGSSYLPVRAMGEALNMDVSFDADLGIELKEKEKGAAIVSETTTPSTGPTKEEIENKINFLKTQIRIANIDTGSLEESIKNNPDKATEYRKLIETLKLRITDYESQLAALEAQK